MAREPSRLSRGTLPLALLSTAVSMPQLPQLISAPWTSSSPFGFLAHQMVQRADRQTATPPCTRPMCLAILCLTHPFTCEPQEKGSPLPSTRLSSPASMGRPKRVECKVGICIHARKQLVIVKGELETAQRKLADRRDPSNLISAMVGERRRWDAEYHELHGKYESTLQTHARMTEANRGYLETSKNLEAERLVLLNEIAELKAAALISAGQLAAFSRRESSSARLHSINEKRLAAEGMAALAAAGKIVAEAERREADAVASEADAVSAEAAAKLGAAAARQEAMLEAEAARDAHEARAISEHQSMLLARQVARAQQKSVDLEERINLMSTPRMWRVPDADLRSGHF